MKSVIICDMEGLITNLNDGASKMFGYNPKDLVGIKRVSIFSPGEIVRLSSNRISNSWVTNLILLLFIRKTATFNI